MAVSTELTILIVIFYLVLILGLGYYIKLIPYCAAVPPNPTIADVLINVAPYDRAITIGCVFRPATI